MGKEHGTDYYIQYSKDSIEIIDIRKSMSDIRKAKIVIDSLTNKSKYKVMSVLLLSNESIKKHKDILDLDEELSTENNIAKTISRLRTIFSETYLPKKYPRFKWLEECTREEYYDALLNYFKENYYKPYYYQNRHIGIISLIKKINDGYYDLLFENCIERKDLLLKIEEKLKNYRITGLIGGPSAGKTVLAIDYASKKGARRYNNEYHDVFMVNCKDEESFRKSLGIPLYDGDCVYECFDDIVSKKIEELILVKNKYLFIFDDITVSNKCLSSNEYISFGYFVVKMMNDLVNSIDNIHIIYTSRASLKINRNDLLINVRGLEEYESIKYLMDTEYLYTEDEVKNITTYSMLPCFLNYIRIHNLTLKQYLSNSKNYCLINTIKDIKQYLNNHENGRIFNEIIDLIILSNGTILKNQLLEIMNHRGYDSYLIEHIINEYNYKLNLLIYNYDYLSIDNVYMEAWNYIEL